MQRFQNSGNTNNSTSVSSYKRLPAIVVVAEDVDGEGAELIKLKIKIKIQVITQPIMLKASKTNLFHQRTVHTLVAGIVVI